MENFLCIVFDMRTQEGDKTTCEECGKEYIYFIWAFGSDRRYCKPCLRKGRSAHGFDCLNDDAIDLEAEQDWHWNMESYRIDKK